MAKMEAARFDRIQVGLDRSEKHEFNINHGEIKLLRTGLDRTLSLTGIRQQRQASLRLNNLTEDGVNRALTQLREMAEGAQPDPAHDIAPVQSPESFQQGPESPDYDLMYDRLSAFNRHVTENHPLILLEEAVLDFSHHQSLLLNSNGVDFKMQQGVYGFEAMFTAKQGRETSSLNYTGYSAQSLDSPIWERGYLDQLLTQSGEQLRTRRIPEKFTGPVIITPHALEDFIGFLTDQIGTGPMIAGTSIYREKLGQQVAAEGLTLHCRPRGEEIADGYFLTGDGIKAENLTLVDRGILGSYLLDIYGSNKAGLQRAVNDGECLVVEPGETTLKEMISGIDRGLMMCRFSGGEPNDKGDFSGVAKNSYFIEKGKIAYPVSETMVSGNMARLLKEIDAVSRERVDFGSKIIPWVRAGGLTIS
jgi:PmbA protein